MNPDQRHAMHRILKEVEFERMEQHMKWGQQDHPNITGFYDREVMQAVAEAAKQQTDEAARAGRLSYKHILEEEFCEAMAELDNTELLRIELLQLAAVAVAWVEAIDRRGNEQRP